MKNALMTLATLALGFFMTAETTAAQQNLDYQVLSTSRLSTMEKELNEAAAAGYRFVKVTNGPNILGGQELIVVTVKDSGSAAAETREYRVLKATGTSNLQKKLREAARDGYEYLGQTTLPNIVGGTDVVVILERKDQNE